MLDVKDILKVLKSYNIDSTNFGPSIYKSNSNIGLSLEIKDDTFGFLTRYFIFQTKKELEEFLKSFFWYKKNKDKWKISLSLDNYEIPNPKIKYTYNDTELNYNDMINLETNIANAEKENNEDIERNSLIINIEGLTNYLINLKENKYKIRKEKNELKIKENELKYELLEALNKYYGKTKAITKRPVNLDIINNSNDKEQLQENLKNIKQKSINEIETYLNNLIDIVKNEELEDKYIINIYSNNIYKYNIGILNKQIEFVKKKIESEKNFNLKGSKIHNIDEELKSFLKTNSPPPTIKNYLAEIKTKLEDKYNKINDNKNSYTIISGTLIRMPVKKNIIKNKFDSLEKLNKEFDNLSAKKKAYAILYNSFYKETCDIIKNNLSLNIEEIKKLINVENSYKIMEEIAHLETNSHYLANYFKYINFKNIDTYISSLIDITKIVSDITFKLTSSLKVFCIEKKDNKELLSINPIFNKKEKTYITTLPENTKVLYIPDKINIDSETNELSIISSKNIYLSSEIIDTCDMITVNKYQKKNEANSEHGIIITTDLILKETYHFNVGLIEGE